MLFPNTRQKGMPSQRALRNGYVMVFKHKDKTSQIPTPKPRPPQAVLDALKQILGVVAFVGRIVGKT